ncbi:hypothetical protein V8E36_000342 [Tilletia maclaganii]
MATTTTTTTEAQYAEHNDKLPKLPIPSLEDSCRRYLASLEHLQSPEEHAQTKNIVASFLKQEGPQMQKSLEDYASTRSSYIAEFWDESYLSASDSVVLALNPFFVIEDSMWHQTQLSRAAALILASLSFVHDLRTGQLPADSVRGTPLDMAQYSRLFGTARIPTSNGCRLESYDHAASHVVVMRRGQMYWFEALDHNHQPLFTEHALLQNLKAIVADADKLPRSQVSVDAVGVLTTEKRKTWSVYRELLHSGSGENNRRALQVVDSALFVVCLDDWAPTSSSVPAKSGDALGSSQTDAAAAAQLCNNMLCGTYQLEDGVQVGTCVSRYYDKLQIIICSNGAAGINFEHTGVDGHTVLRFVADIYTELIMRFAKSINSATQSLFKAKTSPYAKGIGGKRPVLFETPAKQQQAQEEEEEEEEEEEPPEFETSPRKLEWDLTPQLRDAIKYGETRLSDLICQNECQVLVFEGYGKSFLTRHRFSPDAFVQMAFQAAYFALYGRAATTYEPAMVKQFLRGRTEAIRTVQKHSVDFTRTWFQPASSLSSTASDEGASAKRRSTGSGSGTGPARPTTSSSGRRPEECIAALRKACEGHTKLTRECSRGLGHDRHLYALLQVWKKNQAESVGKGGKGEDMPALFRDGGWQTLNTTIISTSNCGNPALRLFGFGPVSPQGLGLGYIIKDNEIAICASSKHLQTGRYLDALSRYLREVGEVIIENHKAANSRPSATFIDHSGRECDVRTGKPLGSSDRRGAVGRNVATTSSGLSNGYDDFERGLSSSSSSSSRGPSGGPVAANGEGGDSAERPAHARAQGSTTMGSAGYGFFDAGGAAGSGEGGRRASTNGKIKKKKKHGAAVDGGEAGSGAAGRSALMEEIAGVGRTILFNEYS